MVAASSEKKEHYIVDLNLSNFDHILTNLENPDFSRGFPRQFSLWDKFIWEVPYNITISLPRIIPENDP